MTTGDDDLSRDTLAKWQNLVDLMARVMAVPAALIMKVHDTEIEVLLASDSEANPYKKGERANLKTGLYCETVMARQAPLWVPDASKDPDWDQNPDMALNMVSYLGFPLTWPDGTPFGTICVLDERDNPTFQTYRNLVEEFAVFIEQDLRLIQAGKEQESLSDRLRLLGQAIDQATSAIFMTDTEGGIVSVNPAFTRATGYVESEVLGRNPRILKSGLQEQAVYEGLWERLKSGQDWLGELCNRNKQGKYYWVMASLSPVRDSSGRVTHYLAVEDDITDYRKQAARYRALVQNIPGVVYRCQNNELWTMNYISEGMKELSGYPATDFLEKGSRSFNSIIHPEDRKRVSETVAEAVEEGRSYTLEYRLVHHNQQPVWVRECGRAVLDSAGNVDYLTGAVFDINDSKLAEQALVEARDDAEAATRAKSAFLAAMSHEIRTPMNAVIGLTHLVLKTPLTDTQLSYVQNILSASQSLLGVINDVLDFSKIEAGKIRLESVDFPLRYIVNSISRVVGFQAEEKKIALNIDIDDGLPEFLRGDPLRLVQILTNLVGNGVKFTERGAVNLRINPRGVDGDRLQLCFEVADTGIGMTPEEVAGLFQAFSQADDSITRKFGGTGLGLTISKRLVDLMGGTISVTSKLGSGSTFTVQVPLEKGCPTDDFRADRPAVCESDSDRSSRDIPAAGPAPVVSAEEPVVEQQDSDQTPLSGLRLLLVEDNPVNQMVASELLQSGGAIVEVVNDGAEAVERVCHSDESRPGLDGVLMDLQMPVMDGYQATRQIRADPRFAELPIIAMTAHALEDERKRCLAAGMNDHIPKPIDPQNLFRTVCKHLRR